jgi:HAD superfamily hydrolase (TIGR01509 family)
MIRGVIFDLGNTLVQQVVDEHVSLSAIDIRLLPGARGCLERLCPLYRMAVLSNTERTTSEELEALFARLGLAALRISLFTSVSIGVRKPAPEAFMRVARALKIAPAELVMVGNDPREDIASAQALGMHTVYVGPAAALGVIRPDLILGGVGELFPDLLERLGGPDERQAGRSDPSATDRARDPGAPAGDRAVVDDPVAQRAQAAMREAVALEQGQDWRRAGTAWLNCARLLTGGMDQTSEEYVDAEVTIHNFPNVDAKKWGSMTQQERAARAFRYAGYHFEGDGERQSSYRFYWLSGVAFEGAEDFNEAGRSYFLALVSYARRFGELEHRYLERLEAATQKVVHSDPQRYVARMLIYYRHLATAFRAAGNYEAFMALRQRRHQTERRALMGWRTLPQYVLASAWAFLTGDGQSLTRWFATLLVFTIVTFPLVYRYGACVTPPPGILDAFAFSVGRVVPQDLPLPGSLTPVGRAVSVLQSTLAVLWLGVLVNIVSTRSQE